MREQWLQAAVNGVAVMVRLGNGNIIQAACLAANIPSAKAGYNKGCQLFVTDGATEATTLYINTGTSASCTFTAFDYNFAVNADLSDLLASAAEINRAADVSTRIVTVTATPLVMTELLHDGKTLVLDKADGLAITLPAAAAGLKFEFIVKTTFTSASTIKSATGADVMIGHAIMGNNSDNTVVNFPAVAGNTYDTIDLLGTGNSTGGMAGQRIRITGLAVNLWYVEIIGDAAGSEATPFADSVA